LEVHVIRRCFVLAFVPIALMLQIAPAAQSAAPADIRRVLEGTWTLEEWHADGQIMRPPEMTGRWMVHDGIVMAIRHRNGPKNFESTAAYGEYRITADEWIYGYERSDRARKGAALGIRRPGFYAVRAERPGAPEVSQGRIGAGAVGRTFRPRPRTG
jgi:hypothetical protein